LVTASLLVLATCLATPAWARKTPSQDAPAAQVQAPAQTPAQTPAQAGAEQSNPIPTTPILPDKDFDAALPPISDSPDAPMGTVQDWARQQKTPPANAPTATIAQDGTLAPLPAPDPDLA
jgi:translocation and assembly module TamA